MTKPRPRPPTLYPDEAACNRKARYATEIAARMGAQAVLTNPVLNPPETMFVYCCPTCKGWHCTKQAPMAVTKRDLYAALTPRTQGETR